MQWIIYYEDGSTFSSLNGEPKDAPHGKAQIILSLSARGWVMLSGHDFYAYIRDADGFSEWYEIPDWASLLGRITHDVYHIERILQGLTISDTNWTALYRRAKHQLEQLRKA